MGLIVWITGFPNSGKTTVASELASQLRINPVHKVIHLDGDLLRVLLMATQQVQDTERRILGIQYVRLAKTLARQGLVVIVSAVAIYEEVFIELAREPANKHQVFYLYSDHLSLARRGSVTVPINQELKVPTELPLNTTVVDNSDGQAIQHTVNRILVELEANLSHIRNTLSTTINISNEIHEYTSSPTMIKNYWNNHYQNATLIEPPSTFVTFVCNFFGGRVDGNIIDHGCGDGRDSYFLSDIAPVYALDTSESAIRLCETRRPEKHTYPVHFIQADENGLDRCLKQKDIGLFYSRFVWHSMTLEQELKVLASLNRHLKRGGILAIEARTTLDSLAGQGTKISKDERVLGHYRRFLDISALTDRVRDAKFELLVLEDSKGMSVVGNDDPHLVRLIAKKI
jgi:SAM-dependent methyltransferase